MKKIILLIILILLALGLYFFKNREVEAPEPVITSAITEEGKTPILIKLHLEETGEFLDVKITPVEILEDSRCPSDVQCIQAGTVRLRATLTSGLGVADQVFELGKPITTEAEEITLMSVYPEAISTKQIEKTEYVFSFEVKKR